MTRVISGTLGGRRIAVPPTGTRPTSDRVREALFSALDAAPGLAGVDVLDLCAGSGALGIEALSRGARHALFVESDRRAAATLRRNLTDLGLLGAAQVRTAPVASVLGHPADRAYHLVLADPPYDLPGTEVAGWLGAAESNGWLAPDVTVVVERRVARRGGPFEWPTALCGLRERRYGDTVLFLGVRYGPGS
ncbi:MAG: 16S rRNA (guanine(966)-N(2))-methyltransferase RsmD [Pseudonocardiales bacterium]|nr:16S rRNA (guanine(966)-N(2))-methyltransferase RsmD [Pseudonocardiales bacterium]